MTRWLYLSPHLDDAVLSAGATISARVRSGDEVCVATAFSGTGRQPPDDALELYRRRRAEDLRAAAHLGFEAIHLDLPDAPFRDPSYRTFDAIVFGPDDRSIDLDARDALIDTLGELLAVRHFDHVVAPLGVGGHIDHRLAFAAVSELDLGAPARYYEERPYAFVADAVEVRWGVGLRASGLGSGASEGRREGFVLDNYMVDERDRALSLEKMTRMRAALPEGVRGVGAWQWGGEVFERELIICSEIDAQALTEAVFCYSTQLHGLFGGTSLEAVSAVYEHFAADKTGLWMEAEWIAACR